MKIFTGRLSKFSYLLGLLFLMIVCRVMALSPNAPENLRVFDKSHPVGTDGHPYFGWYVNDPDDNEIQTAYQILVASSQGNLDAGNGDLWDSGKVASGQQNCVYYVGTPLVAAKRFYWKVRTWDKDDNVSPYSAKGVFDTGLFTNADWSSAKWVKRDTEVADDFTYYRKKMTLPDKTIRRALVYLTACHDYQLYINGDLIGKGPAYHYPEYFYYNAYDITDALTSGTENIFAALTHWYGGGQGRPAGVRGFLLKAVVEYTDDTTTIIGTDASWKQTQAAAWVTGQPHRNSGEGVGYVTKIDAREMLDNWQGLSFDDSAWNAAVEIGAQPVSPWTGTLQPDLTDVVEETITPLSVNDLGGGTYVVDFGKVYSGMPSIDFSGGTSGTSVNMRGGYTLNADGTVSTSTDQNTDMSYYCILNGQSAAFEPIVYLGMRYFQVDNSPNPLSTANVRFIKRHYELDTSRSSFTSSDAMLNQVWEVMKHSLTVCAQEAFVDTPTREKAGFLADSIFEGTSAMMTMADRSMNHRTLLEFINSQDQYWSVEGRMNAVYPNGDGKRDIPDFTQMFPLWAWDYYMQTGDLEFLSSTYETIKNIADYVDSCRNGTTGLIHNLAGGSGLYQYGIIDWPATMRYSYDMNAEARTVINAHAWADYDIISRIADVLGNSTNCDTYRVKANAIKDAINTQLLDTSGQYVDGLLSGGTQSSHVSQQANMFPLALGIVPPSNFDTVLAAVKERQMSCGMVTVRFLCEAVGNADEAEHLLDLYTNTNWDGWANNIAKGATTTWESWDADTQGQSMSHAWGAVGLMGIVEYVVGIKLLKPQHELVQIKPLDFGNSLAHVDATLPTDRGDIRVNWNRTDTRFDMSLTLPDNIKAKVYVPQLGISGTTIKVDGSNVTATQEGHYLYVNNIGSGTHTIERAALKAYLKKENSGKTQKKIPAEIEPINAPFPMPQMQRPVFQDKAFNIKDYGAVEGGQVKNTEAMKKAIEACHEAGGGRVVVPEGKWLTGAVHLKSNVNLHVEKGALLEFSEDPQDYLPAVQTTWEGMECFNYSPLIYAFDCVNVAVTGQGTLVAKMDVWKTWFSRPPAHMEALKKLYTMASTNVPVEQRQIAQGENHLRPQFIQFNRCENVLLEGVSIMDSPFWVIHPFLCRDVIIRDVKVKAHGHNNDGVDVEMSQNVLIEDCIFDQGDDAIAIKAGRNQDAWRLDTPTENLVMRNCLIKAGHQLVAIGSELSGGIRNVYVHDCRFENPDDPLQNVVFIKTNDRRGGFVENIYVENIKAGPVRYSMLGIETDILYQWRNLVPTYETRLTKIRNIQIKNVTVDKAEYGLLIHGEADEPVRDITLENVTVKEILKKAREIEHAVNIQEMNVQFGNRVVGYKKKL